MTNVLNVFAAILWLFGSAMVIPSAVAVAFGEFDEAMQFIIISVLTIFLAGSMAFSVRSRAQAMNRAESYVLLLVVWTVLPLVATVPLLTLSELTPLDAYVEAVSGLTTTGFTVYLQLDEVSRAVLFWRSQLQWIGGLLTLWSLLLIIAPYGVGGLPYNQVALMGGTAGREVTSAVGVALNIARLYGVLTLVCVIALIAAQVPLYDAICLAFSTVSTGGFLPRDGDLSSYANGAVELVVMVFMLAGATSIVWFRMMQSRWQLLTIHRESYLVVSVAVILGAVYAILLFRAAGSATVLDPLTAWREGFFTAVSLVTTTGFEVRQSGFAVLPMPVVLFFVLIGAGSFATSGGIKYYRVGAMLTQAGRELNRLIYPHSVRSSRLGGHTYDIQLMKAIWAYFLTVVIFVPVVGVLLSGPRLSFDGALLASAAAFANAGPVYASGWLPGAEQWPSVASMSAANKVVLCATMILGRIEILALFGALNRTYWFNR